MPLTKSFDFAENAYENALNTIDAQGVEVELNWNAMKNLNVSANYTFTERKGDNAIRIPKHKINADFGYTFSDRIYASLQYSYTGSRSDTDFNAFPAIDVPLEAFSLVNLYASHECIQNRLKVFVNMNNILNQGYTEVLGFTTLGRNLLMGFSLSL